MGAPSAGSATPRSRAPRAGARSCLDRRCAAWSSPCSKTPMASNGLPSTNSARPVSNAARAPSGASWTCWTARHVQPDHRRGSPAAGLLPTISSITSRHRPRRGLFQGRRRVAHRFGRHPRPDATAVRRGQGSRPMASPAHVSLQYVGRHQLGGGVLLRPAAAARRWRVARWPADWTESRAALTTGWAKVRRGRDGEANLHEPRPRDRRRAGLEPGDRGGVPGARRRDRAPRRPWRAGPQARSSIRPAKVSAHCATVVGGGRGPDLENRPRHWDRAGRTTVDEVRMAGGGSLSGVTDVVGRAARPALAHQPHGALEAERIEPVTIGIALLGELSEPTWASRGAARRPPRRSPRCRNSWWFNVFGQVEQELEAGRVGQVGVTTEIREGAELAQRGRRSR